MIRVLALVLLMSSSVLSQTITPTKVNVTSGYTNPRVVGPYVLHGDFSLPVSRTGMLLAIELASKDQKLFDVYADAIPSLEAGDLQILPDGSYLLVGSGKYRVVAFFENPSAVKRFDVELGPPKPDPRPDPDPEPDPEPSPVPPDKFDNVGQRTAALAKGLPWRAEVAKLYRQCADDLESDPTATINSAVDKIVKARAALLKPAELAAYQPLLDALNTDIRKRYPIHPLVVAEYFQCIATGLEGAK